MKFYFLAYIFIKFLRFHSLHVLSAVSPWLSIKQNNRVFAEQTLLW